MAEGLSALTAWHAAWAVGAALSAVAGATLGWLGVEIGRAHV